MDLSCLKFESGTIISFKNILRTLILSKRQEKIKWKSGGRKVEEEISMYIEYLKKEGKIKKAILKFWQLIGSDKNIFESNVQ